MPIKINPKIGQIFQKDTYEKFVPGFLNTKKKIDDTGSFLPLSGDSANFDVTENQNTRVFEIDEKDFSVIVKTPCISAVLKVTDGDIVDKGIRTVLIGNRVNIGRRPSNELSLNDKNISRLHAYILFEGNSYVIYDAQSLNGTYVNGIKITSKKLSNKDMVTIGNTTIIYEEK